MSTEHACGQCEKAMDDVAKRDSAIVPVNCPRISAVPAAALPFALPIGRPLVDQPGFRATTLWAFADSSRRARMQHCFSCAEPLGGFGSGRGGNDPGPRQGQVDDELIPHRVTNSRLYMCTARPGMHSITPLPPGVEI
jgi:hypothetical protein